MCEQTHINLSHVNLGDLTYPSTGLGTSSPISNFNALSIHRVGSGDSAAPSTHSSLCSGTSGKFACAEANLHHADICSSSCSIARSLQLTCHGSDRDACPQGRPGVAGPSDMSAENIGRKER